METVGLNSRDYKTIAQKTDKSNIKYGCGHGALGVKEEDKIYTDCFCEMCIVDLPPFARREMVRKAKYFKNGVRITNGN